MHICYVLHSFPLVSETFISDEIYELLINGHKITIISINKSNHELIHTKAQFAIKNSRTINLTKISRIDSFINFLQFALGNPIRSIKLAWRIKNSDSPRWINAQLTQILKILPTTIDVIHAHFADTQLLYAEALAVWLEKKFSFTVHGYDLRNLPIGKANLIRLSRSANKVIAYSKSNIEDLKQIGVCNDKISLIPCGIDISSLGPQSDEYCGGALNIICIARLHPIKCHSVILHAIKKLVDNNVQVNLLLVGYGELRLPLEELAKTLNIEKYVRFTGACEHMDVLNHLRSAHIHVLASLHEGLGVANLEAMAMGLAVIGTNVGGLAEVIVNESNGLLIPPNCSDELAIAIQRIYNNPQLWKTLSENARSFCIENYSRKILTNKFLAAITSENS